MRSPKHQGLLGHLFFCILAVCLLLPPQAVAAQIQARQKAKQSKKSFSPLPTPVELNQQDHEDLKELRESFFSTPMSERDLDPFFLKSQAWLENKEVTQEGEALFVQIQQKHIEVSFQDAPKVLRLKAPFRPIFSNHGAQIDSRYLFLSLDESILQDRPQLPEGIYFINLDILRAAAHSDHHSPVPIFALPLPADTASSWLHNSDSGPGLYQDESTPYVFQDRKGDTIVISPTEILSIEKASMLNLQLARTQQMGKYDGPWRQEMRHRLEELKSAEHLSDEQLFSQLKSLSARFAHKFPKPDEINLTNCTAWGGLAFVGCPVANADSSAQLPSGINLLPDALAFDGGGLLSSPGEILKEFLDKSDHLLLVMGGITVLSVVLRWTVFKKKLDARKKKPGFIESHTDSLVHSFTGLLQFPFVWGHAITRGLLDKLRIGIRSNSFIGKLYDATIGYTRQAHKRTPVNSKLFWMSSVWLGMINVFITYIISFQLVPNALKFIASSFPSTQATLLPILGDEKVSLYFMISLFFTGLGWLTSGAFSMAYSIYEFYFTKTKADIEQRISSGQLTLTRRQKEKLIEEKAQAEGARRGFPDGSYFLGDANSTYSAVMGKASGLNVKEEDQSSFWYFERPALLPRVINRAIDHLIDGEKTPKQVRLLQTLVTIREGYVKKNFILGALSNFKNKKRRKIMHSAAVGLTWHDPDTERQERLELLEDCGVPFQELEDLGVSKKDYLNAQDYVSENFEDLVHPTLKKKKKKDAPAFAEFNPKNELGWYGRRQYKKLVARVQQELLEAKGEEGWSDEEFVSRLKKAFVAKMGLIAYRQNHSLNKEIDRRVETSLNYRFRDKGFQKEWIKLGPEEGNIEKLSLRAYFEATEFVSVYWDFCIGDERLHSSHPAQPGALNWLGLTKLRQWLARKKNKKGKLPFGRRILTRVVRAAEAFGSTERGSYGLGFSKILFRNVPFVHDIWYGLTRELKNTPARMLFSYAYGFIITGLIYPPILQIARYILLGGIIGKPVWMVTNRMLQHLGMKQGDNFKSMTIYGAVGGFFTTLLTTPIILFLLPYIFKLEAVVYPEVFEAGRQLLEMVKNSAESIHSFGGEVIEGCQRALNAVEDKFRGMNY